MALMGASDEDALDLVSSFPLASKHVHSLSLRCSSVTDRGLETLLDHLQVGIIDIFCFCSLDLAYCIWIILVYGEDIGFVLGQK